MAYNIDFLRNVSTAGEGAVYKTEGRDLAVVQVDGSFTSVRIALEGRLIADEGTWERIGVYRVEAPNDTLSVINNSGIYECPIFGLSEIRFTVLSIEGGSINVAGFFYDTANGETYPYKEIEGYKMIQMGESNLFVKGVAEQIFMDPTTGNIVGYDRTAANASVATQVNLQEIVGGMGNRLVGILPDSVRVNGTYESAAFSLETREKIMGGQIAYDAVAAVCEKITADDSGELTVSQKPAPFYGEGSLPEVRVQKYAEFSDASYAAFEADEAVPAESFVIDINPVQEGTGDPAPDNVRPIFGWTGAKIRQSAKNMLDPSVLYTGTGYNSAVGTKLNIAESTDHLTDNGDGTFSISLAAWGNRAFVFDLIPGESMRFSATFQSTNAAVSYGYLSQDNTVLASTSGRGASVVRNLTVTGTSDRRKFFINFGPGESADTVTVIGPQLELGSASTDYEPYNGNTLNMAFPTEAGTVYEGTLDVLTGDLSVTHRGIVLTGNENWALSSSSYNNAFYITNSLPGAIAYSKELICSHYPANTKDATPNNNVYIDSGYRLLISANNVEHTVEAWKAYLQAQAAAGTPVVVVYKSRPGYEQNYQLTPEQVTGLTGVNIIRADCGNIQFLKIMTGWETEEADGNVFRAYVRESGVGTYTGEAYGVDAKTQKVIGFAAEEGKTYEVTYYTHNASASMLPIPSMWNPVVMTVQVRYGVYAKQNAGDSANRGVLKGWMYFIVPRAILTADAGVNGSQTGTATTDGSWMALTNKAENLPMCSDCDGSSDPMAYYVFVPCGDANESVEAIISVGGGMVLNVGKKKQLPIKLLLPDDTLAQPDYTTLNYTSDDETVATVTANGEVVGVGTGATIINAYLPKEDGTVLSCKTMVVVA